MAVYKDEKTGKWYCKFYYHDHTGKRKQKMKRGFALQRDAKKWESDFLAKMEGSPEMPFSELAELYLEDKKNHAKVTTYVSIRNRVNNWLVPAFKDRPVNQITAAEIRNWQGTLKQAKTRNGNPLSTGYMQVIVMELSGIFNYGVRYYKLPANPCKVAGNLVGKKNKSVAFWTEEQFQAFIRTFDKEDPYYTMFMILYYTGMRKGELQALTPADINLKEGTISITKTFKIVDGERCILPPKTPKSNRTVTIPPFLCDIIRDFESRIYGMKNDDMIFCYGRSTYAPRLDKHAKLAGIPRIRVHDLRHSHASLLIDLGFSATLVAERLGHENVSTTLDIYSHLFPSKQSQVAEKLQKMHEKEL